MCKNSLYFTFTSCVQKKDKYVVSNGPEFFFVFGLEFCFVVQLTKYIFLKKKLCIRSEYIQVFTELFSFF